MAIKKVTLKESMNRNIQSIMPIEEQKIEFKKNIEEYISNLLVKDNESEEFQKNLLKKFLENTLPENFINTSKKVDLAIYNGENPTGSLGVLFEVKSLTNKSEMMTVEKINTKAFQEIISYYLYERIFEKNLEIKKCIVTNGLSWFMIEAKEIEKHFFNTKKLVDMYQKFWNGQLSGNKTDFLYEEVISPEIDKAISNGIAITHFDLLSALKSTNPVDLKKNNLTQLYRFFTAENLLNKEIYTDSNKLNKSFYSELLYIMGLEENKKGNSKVISRLKSSKRQQFSFIENAIDRLNMKDIPDDQQYEIAMELTVTWINRILFLKLLESQLILFNKDDSYKFLTYEKIPTFEDLYDLFFGIMAKPTNNRSEYLKEKYCFVPYLNSSLFEETALESSTIGIGRLKEGEIKLFSNTVIKGANGKRKIGSMNYLEYLFAFLDSYDFSTTVSKDSKVNNTLINASVLGLIFEKINGYQDGAFFTPGKITMYMSRDAVRKTVIDKINSELHWECNSIKDLKFKINSIEVAKKVSDIIDDLKICDPAVGSGHFLVSILNEIIALKSEINTLFDYEGNILNKINCYVSNDELIIQDYNGDNFVYYAKDINTERIQKSLFIQKKTIIENCLFGVDINSNSANICRLRLWIELLKNSYYYENESSGKKELATLPNIDINIKVGDSLLYKFDFDSEFDLRRKDFKEYFNLVKEYKETKNKSTKSEINKRINQIKEIFNNNFISPEIKELARLMGEMNKVGQINLFDGNEKDRIQFEELKKKKNKAEKDLKNSINKPIYNNSMEWRIEFPEILSDSGDFLGFDLVIGNPPYIFARNKSFSEEMKKYYQGNYIVNEYQSNTYTLFIELAYKLMKKDGNFSFIIPNNFLTIQSNSKMREFLISKCGDIKIINSFDKIFSDADVDNCILFFKKTSPNWIEVSELEKGEVHPIGKVEPNYFGDNPIFSISMVKYQKAIEAFWKVDKHKMLNRKEIATVKSGIKAYETGKGKPKMTSKDKDDRIYHSQYQIDETYKKYINGSDVCRYILKWSGEWIKYGPNLAAMRDPIIFNNPRILVRQIPSQSNEYTIEATYTNSQIINDLNSMIITDININPLCLLGIINSKLLSLWFLMKFDKFQRRIFPQFKVNELGEFRIPDVKIEDQENLANKVEFLMNEIKNDDREPSRINELNREIDEIVMELFELNEDEKQSIREFTIQSKS